MRRGGQPHMVTSILQLMVEFDRSDSHDNSKLQIGQFDLLYLEAQENALAVLTNSRISEQVLQQAVVR